MKKALKGAISVMLVLSMMICAVIPAFAAGEEEYICELRLIYSDDYLEAEEILADSEFNDYKIVKKNLNQGSGETGVWLAYKTTTDIDDAITDISIMQMQGGYSDGNFQEMLKESYEEYVSMGEIYLNAIEYFVEAYDADSFLAKSAYRQLNFYNVISEGIPEDDIPDFEGERIGDIFRNGITEYELATMFLQGNSYALNNIRSLIAMGVSYNEDGKTYLEKVGDAAAEMTADPNVYADEDYDDLAALISSTITIFGNMFKELEHYEADLNYTDEEYTDEEIKYAEYKAIAEMMRKITYLDGKTLYSFCYSYKTNENDYSELYPLIDALNDGQLAMTKVAHYYDVVRYSMSSFPEEEIDAQITELENTYSETPFNIYTGVDRTVYYGTFALTSEAYRADAYTESGLSDAFFGEGNALATSLQIGAGTVGLGLFIWAIVRNVQGVAAKSSAKAMSAYLSTLNASKVALGKQVLNNYVLNGVAGKYTYDQIISATIMKANPGFSTKVLSNMTFSDKLNYLSTQTHYQMTGTEQNFVNLCNKKLNIIQDDIVSCQQAKAASVAKASNLTGALTGILYIVGGALMLYSAISLGMTVYNYYHPDYDDIPVAMVDLIKTADGDRYIKYDVALEVEVSDDGDYAAGDLNAFAGKRWNALYYTKSYEAGKPLLADEFIISTKSNVPKENYAPVHRFGEVVCYNLNRYNFNDDTSIYLSVKQSRNQKSAVADVPEVVGSMFGAGYIFIAGGIGAVAGIGGTLITKGLMKKNKSKAKIDAET